jgi:signal transduction histidine kinase
LTGERRSTIDWYVIGIASDAHRPWRAAAGWIAAALVTGALAMLAAGADLAPDGLDPAATVADLTVGLSFVGAAAIAPGPWRCRLTFAAVGLAWLFGSVVPAAYLAYLPVLGIALATFPTGRPTSVRDGVLIAASLIVAIVAVAAVLVPPIPALAALFAAIAATSWTGQRWARAAAVAPAVAAAALAFVLGTSWLAEATDPFGYDASLWLQGLELVLIVVAAGFPVASWLVIRERASLADRLVGDERGVGLDGLAVLLADTLGDPELRIVRWDVGAGGYVGSDGRAAQVSEGASTLLVADGDARLAAIVHLGTRTMDDSTISAAVTEAVRLTALNERWQAAQATQLAELEAARGRLLLAADRQRAATAARLRDEVVHFIEVAGGEIRRIDDAANGAEAREALDVARRELDASADEVLALISGLPPAMLGDGGLVEAIRNLAARCPLPVSVEAPPDARSDFERETALFYVCSEALANTIKHARASRISIDLHHEGDDLVIVVRDDGIGGADVSGFGLQGLADRLAVYGGWLRVDSPPGAGTTLTARVAG